MTCRRQTDHVRHLRTGHEREARARGQAEEVLEVAPGHFFDHAGSRAARVNPGILVPGRREPIGRESGWEAAANHPGEESPARVADQSTLDVLREVVDHALGRSALVGEWT